MEKYWTSSKLLLTLVFSAFLIGNVKAGVISIGKASAANPTDFENFDGPFAGQYAGNQYAKDGLTFKTISTNGAKIVDSATCSPPGMSGAFLYIGLIGSCNLDIHNSNGVSIMFDRNVEELSFTAYSYVSYQGYNLDALLNGSLVSSYDVTQNFSNRQVLFKGMVFDEVRIYEAGRSISSLLAIDNMQWRVASIPAPVPSSQIPLPSTASLFAAGIICLRYFLRKKANSISDR